MLSSYLLNSWIKSTRSAESRVILKTVKCSVRWQHKLFHNGHFSPGTNLLGALWVLLLRQWLPLLGVTCWFLIRPQHLPVERPHIYIFILSSLLNLRHLLGIIFWMSNGPLKPKIVKTALSSKIAGDFSYCGQDTCSGFLFLFFSHLTYNSSEDCGGYGLKIYLEAGHFSLSLPVTTLLWATTVFSLACFNSLQLVFLPRPFPIYRLYSTPHPEWPLWKVSQIMEFLCSKCCKPPQFNQSQLFKNVLKVHT